MKIVPQMLKIRASYLGFYWLKKYFNHQYCLHLMYFWKENLQIRMLIPTLLNDQKFKFKYFLNLKFYNLKKLINEKTYTPYFYPVYIRYNYHGKRSPTIRSLNYSGEWKRYDYWEILRWTACLGKIRNNIGMHIFELFLFLKINQLLDNESHE